LVDGEVFFNVTHYFASSAVMRSVRVVMIDITSQPC
jgi:hypothetical protein